MLLLKDDIKEKSRDNHDNEWRLNHFSGYTDYGYLQISNNNKLQIEDPWITRLKSWAIFSSKHDH